VTPKTPPTQSRLLRGLRAFFPGWEIVELDDRGRFFLVEGDARTAVIGRKGRIPPRRLRGRFFGLDRFGRSGQRARLDLGEIGVQGLGGASEILIERRQGPLVTLLKRALDLFAQDAHPSAAKEARIVKFTASAFDATFRETCRDIAAFDAFAATFAQRLRPGDVVALEGPLGAGKTRFARAVVRAIQGHEDVSSPTFTLRHRYERLGRTPVEHLDGYRIETPEELAESGLEEAFDGSAIVLVEWPDRLASLLPPRRYRVAIAGGGEEPRSLRIEVPA